MQARKLKVLTVAVKDLDRASETFQANFGFRLTRRAEDAKTSARSAYLGIGESEIELVEQGGADGPVGKFVDERGEGLYLLKLQVDDLDAAVRDLKARGVEVRREIGGGGQPVLWLSPRGTNGVLLQLTESER